MSISSGFQNVYRFGCDYQPTVGRSQTIFTVALPWNDDGIFKKNAGVDLYHHTHVIRTN
jgi:hypothetical protein